ncbi:hypothetical protein Bca52824_007343 [Brassica carinata]|uniref:Uncharacterized protein n=1 Tax=Brassica carinata TaxID=52824 RepID=A0A8X7W933_BRACI|nr:hypothetical protein Bca52824_007343 [Brassica carinata]
MIVCSTCVVRLRFVLCDPRCCICKTESPVIFVTKALGDYTRTINDFSTFPSAPKEGRVAGGFWYHEDTQAFFDDLDQYRMIKAMYIHREQKLYTRAQLNQHIHTGDSEVDGSESERGGSST